MSIQTATVLKILQVSSCVKIRFNSLSYNKEHEGLFTLKDKHMNISPDSDTIVCWDIENQKWQDIRTSSITFFIGIPDDS